MPVNALGSIKCYSTCPRVSRMNVTWCVHIYHPAEEVNICFNNSGLISLTPLAATLNLHTQFSVSHQWHTRMQHAFHAELVVNITRLLFFPLVLCHSDLRLCRDSMLQFYSVLPESRLSCLHGADQHVQRSNVYRRNG